MACLFCAIIEGSVPAHRLYEDGDVLAFLDARPAAPGHTLLIPKTHAARVEDRERAESHNRMAVIHREEGRQHDAFLEFQEAGIIWDELKAPWEGAVTSAFVAEGYHIEGKREKANKYLEEAFKGMSQAKEGKEKMARGYLYMAGCANSIGRLDLERLALERGMVFAQSLEDGELFIELNDRLMSLPS